MGLANDAFGTLFTTAYTGGGGGGVTTIPNGGDIGGTYSGDVYCEGDVNITSSVTVKGSLYVVGTVFGPNGDAISVEGNVYSHSWNLNRTDTSLPQQNINIGGDFLYTYFEWAQSGGVVAQFRVGGNVTGTAGYSGSPFFASGVDGTATSGANVLVYGTWSSGEVLLEGSDASSTAAAGNGGTFYIYNHVSINGSFELDGGRGSLGYDAGSGGDIEVYGNFNVSSNVRLAGGYGQDSSGGSGGDISIYGHACCNDIRLEGGDGDVNGGNGGSGFFNGDVAIDDFWCTGGSGYNGNGGTGANISIDGNCTCDDIEIDGGSGSNGNGGNGGYFYIDGSLACSQFSMDGGSANNGNGGSGGYLGCDADVSVYDLNFRGGYASNGSSGNGGNVNVDGTLTVGYIEGSGGYCDSGNETHTASYGGTLYTNLLSAELASIYMRGGNRGGNTSVTNPMVVSNNGGSLNVEGNATFGWAYLDGGDVSTSYQNAAGGAGGNVSVFGSLRCNGIRCDGGDSNGYNGGDGGDIVINGHAVVSTELASRGGDSNASTDAPAGGVSGPGSSNVSLRGGCRVRLIDLSDGAGVGTAPSANTNLYLGGSCHFAQVNMSSRPECFIRPLDMYEPVIFQASIMPVKDTLNTYDGGAATASLSADLETSIFTTTSNGAGNWYKITGVSAM